MVKYVKLISMKRLLFTSNMKDIEALFLEISHTY